MLYLIEVVGLKGFGILSSLYAAGVSALADHTGYCIQLNMSAAICTRSINPLPRRHARTES